MVRKILNLLLIIGLMGFFATGVGAEDTEEPDLKGELSIGYHFNDINGSNAKTGEYENLDQGGADGPDIGFSLSNWGDDFGFDFGGLFYGDKNDQDYHLNADLKRIFLERYEYKRFNHSLDHDPLTNLSASCGGPKVSHEDFEAGRDYAISYSEQKSNTTVNIPFLPGAQIGFDYRQQLRKGHRQALTTSKCAACHVSSHGRSIDEETEDYSAKAKMKFGWLTLMYNFLHRDFSERANAPVNYYDNAMHPENGIDMFDDRLQYDGIGLKYSRVPSSEKDTHLIKALATLPMSTSIYASFLCSDIENRENDLSVDQDVIVARITNQMIPALKLSLNFKYLTIDNDDADVDVNEQVADAGPNAGYTWANPNPSLTYNHFDPDFKRLSSMSRDITTLGFGARYRLWRATTFKLEYEYENIDRDNYEVSRNETETTTNTIKVGLKTRFNSKLKAGISYKRDDIDDPFNNPGATCSVVDPTSVYGTPWVGIQYWELQDNRVSPLTNQPTAINEVKADAHWTIKPNLSCNVNVVWIDKENDNLRFSGWEQTSYKPSINFWYAPMERLSFNLSYMYDETETESPLHGIGVFDG